MGVPARNAVYASSYVGMKRLVLLGIAEYSTDETSPFEAWPGLKSIAYCAGLSERQTQRYIHALIEAGALERCRMGQTRWAYRLLLDSAPISAVTTDDTPHPDVSPDDTPEFSGVTTDDTPAYPYGVTTDDTPHVSGVTYSRSGVTSGVSGVTYSRSGVTSDASLIRNRKNIERREREEKELPDNPRVREGGDLSDPKTVHTIFSEMLQYARDHIDEPESLNNYEVTASEIDLWAKKITPTMPGPRQICFRGPRDLTSRGSVFRGVMAGIASELYDGRIWLDYWAV